MPISSFPLRFEEEATRKALHEVSEQTGISMNRLVQDAIAAHLRIATKVLEERFERSLGALSAYRGRWTQDEIAAFAHAEVEYDDPATGRMVEEAQPDPYGVVAAFANTLE